MVILTRPPKCDFFGGEMATYTPKEVTFRAHVWVEAVNVILPSENVTVRWVSSGCEPLLFGYWVVRVVRGCGVAWLIRAVAGGLVAVGGCL